MGLDMYLEARRTYSDYNALDVYEAVAEATGMPDGLDKFAYGRMLTVSFSVAYWRKAYSINEWLRLELDLDNGVERWVDLDTLRELRDNCKQVLEHHEDASDLIPCYIGEYGDSYYEELQRTLEMLNHICDNIAYNGYEFYYTMSY